PHRGSTAPAWPEPRRPCSTAPLRPAASIPIPPCRSRPTSSRRPSTSPSRSAWWACSSWANGVCWPTWHHERTDMVRTEHPLLSPSLGHQKTLVSFQYGDPSARPKVYLQASLHAEELPGMLVAHHLRPALERAEREGRLRGHVVLVP